MALTEFNKFNKLNFEDLNISNNLDSKIQGEFYNSALKKSENLILTSENSLCLRKGSYLINQIFNNSSLPRKLLDLNSSSGYFYASIGNKIYLIFGDTSSSEATYIVKDLNSTVGSSSKLINYAVQGKTTKGTNYTDIEIEDAVIFTYNISTTSVPNYQLYGFGSGRTKRATNTFSTPMLITDNIALPLTIRPNILFFQSRLVVAHDKKIQMSRSISADVQEIQRTTFPPYINNPGGGAYKLYLPEVSNTNAQAFNGFRLRLYLKEYLSFDTGASITDWLTSLEYFVPSTGDNWDNTGKYLTISTAFPVTDWLAMSPITVNWFIELQKSNKLVTHWERFETDFATATFDAINFSLFDLEEKGGSILWLDKYEETLVAGTTQGLYFITASDGGNITPANIKIKKVNDILLSDVKPVIINNVIYAFDVNNNLYGFSFDWRSETIQGIIQNAYTKGIFEFGKLKKVRKLEKINNETLLVIFDADVNEISGGKVYFYVFDIRTNKVVYERHEFGDDYYLNYIDDILVKKDFNPLYIDTNTISIVPKLDYKINILFLVHMGQYNFQDVNKVLGFSYEYDFFKDEIDYETKSLYFDYLQEYREDNLFLDLALLGGTLTAQGTVNYYFVALDLYKGATDIIYVSHKGIIYGPYSCSATNARVYIPYELGVLIGSDKFLYGFIYTGRMITTDIENVANINGFKKIAKVTAFLYNSGNFYFKFLNDDYKEFIDMQNGQIAEALPPLRTGRFDTEGTSFDSTKQTYLDIKTKIGEPFHITGLQIQIQEDTVQ